MIIDITHHETTIIDNERTIKLFDFGFAERSFGTEYLIMSNNKIQNGYPIEPLAIGQYIPGVVYDSETNKAFLIDNAGIIWERRDGVFQRPCMRGAIYYVRNYFGSIYQNIAVNVSLEYHNKWLKKWSKYLLGSEISDDVVLVSEHDELSQHGVKWL